MDKLNKKRKLKVALCLAVYMNIPKKRNRRCWVKEWMENRTYGHMPLLNELRENFPMDFRNYLRMDAESIKSLLQSLESSMFLIN